MRVYISATGLYTYPDLAALCGEPQLEDGEPDILLNPAVLMEVLSPSAEAYDRGAKFDHYRSIESLQTYVLIAQERAQIGYRQAYAVLAKQASFSRPRLI
jgi:Uma2 family endonuclease